MNFSISPPAFEGETERMVYPWGQLCPQCKAFRQHVGRNSIVALSKPFPDATRYRSPSRPGGPRSRILKALNDRKVSVTHVH